MLLFSIIETWICGTRLTGLTSDLTNVLFQGHSTSMMAVPKKVVNDFCYLIFWANKYACPTSCSICLQSVY